MSYAERVLLLINNLWSTAQVRIPQQVRVPRHSLVTAARKKKISSVISCNVRANAAKLTRKKSVLASCLFSFKLAVCRRSCVLCLKEEQVEVQAEHG